MPLRAIAGNGQLILSLSAVIRHMYYKEQNYQRMACAGPAKRRRADRDAVLKRVHLSTEINNSYRDKRKSRAMGSQPIQPATVIGVQHPLHKQSATLPLHVGRVPRPSRSALRIRLL